MGGVAPGRAAIAAVCVGPAARVVLVVRVPRGTAARRSPLAARRAPPRRVRNAAGQPRRSPCQHVAAENKAWRLSSAAARTRDLAGHPRGLEGAHRREGAPLAPPPTPPGGARDAGRALLTAHWITERGLQRPSRGRSRQGRGRPPRQASPGGGGGVKTSEAGDPTISRGFVRLRTGRLAIPLGRCQEMP